MKPKTDWEMMTTSRLEMAAIELDKCVVQVAKIQEMIRLLPSHLPAAIRTAKLRKAMDDTSLQVQMLQSITIQLRNDVINQVDKRPGEGKNQALID